MSESGGGKQELEDDALERLAIQLEACTPLAPRPCPAVRDLTVGELVVEPRPRQVGDPQRQRPRLSFRLTHGGLQAARRLAQRHGGNLSNFRRGR